jgi:hypothetical protein
LQDQSVITRAVKVAAGVFAPGHLGALTQVISFDVVDALLAETGAVQRRVRVLPSRVVVYFVLAMALFGECGYRGVWARLAGGLEGLGLASPSASALRQARRRVGPAPLKALFELLAVPLAWPGMPGTRWRGLIPVAFDGTVVSAPDSPANLAAFGRQGVRNGQTGYPLIRLVTLAECGTRGLLAAVFGSRDAGEVPYARMLLPRLRPGMVVLMDKIFDANAMLAGIAGAGADFGCRLKDSRKAPVLARYPDGSRLSLIAGIEVRVIEAVLTVRRSDGLTSRHRYRLATSLLDHRRYPAPELVRLYHERWEIESAYLAIKDTMVGGRVLRSRHPRDIEQELWALLAVYQALRIVLADAAGTVPGTDPDRTSFTIAFQAARDQLIRASGIFAAPLTDLAGAIGRAALGQLLPRRRMRASPRAVKRPTSRYAYKNLGLPKTSHRITVTTEIT